MLKIQLFQIVERIIELGSDITEKNIALFMKGNDLIIDDGNNGVITVTNQTKPTNAIRWLKI